LGVPVTISALKRYDWEFLDAKFLKRFDSWIRNALSYGGSRLAQLACIIFPSPLDSWTNDG
jgi:hypothetical protein